MLACSARVRCDEADLLRAHSSVGESARLITGWSLVQVQVGPFAPYPLHQAERKSLYLVSIERAVSSAGRALVSQARGHRFNPCTAHHREASGRDVTPREAVGRDATPRPGRDRLGRAPGESTGSALRRAPRFLLVAHAS